MFQKTVLDNGIRILTQKLPAAHSAAVGFWVESGSRHEKEGQGGISHFVEHLLFKGTSRRTAQDIAKEIDSVGGVLNAFTSQEYSCFYAKVAGRKLPLALDLLNDILLHSVFDLDEIEKERRVILQEILMVEDTPDELVHELFFHALWPDHPLGRPILGTLESVKNLDRKALRNLLKNHYCGSNILVCAAGNVNHDDVVSEIRRGFDKLPPGKKILTSPPKTVRHTVRTQKKELEQVHICLGSTALPQGHPDRYACQLLNTALGGSMSSRLFQKLREQRGLAYSVYSYLNSYSDSGALIIYAGTSPEDAPHACGIILKELHQITEHPLSAEELTAAKEHLKGQFLLSLENTENHMTRLARNELYFGRLLGTEEVLERIDKVGSEDILRLAAEIFQDKSLSLQMVGRVDEKDFPLLDLTLGGD
ncbi:MAG: pitrilysin family protein [Syntrophotaleaceae bacterium]